MKALRTAAAVALAAIAFLGFGPGPLSGPAPALADGFSAFRISVTGPGIWRVTGAMWQKEALPARWGLYREGKPVPFFEKDGFLVFAVEPPLPRYAREIALMLRPARAGEKPSERLAGPPTRGSLAWIEENAHHDPLESEEVMLLEKSADRDPYDHFYFGEPKARQAHEFGWDGDAKLAPGRASATIRIVLQGRRRSGASNGVEIKLNGHAFEKARWSGAKPFAFEAKLDPAWLKPRSKANVLELDVFDGKVCLDRIEIDGLALDATPRDARLEPTTERPQPPSADWVAIVAPAFEKAVTPLAVHRTRQRLSTDVVRVQDIFDWYADGTFTPRAIRDFLAHARAYWKKGPRFVLLVGEAGYDVDRLLPREVTVPAALVDTHGNGASASDNWFVCDGDDPIPFAAIGRFPVRTPEECRELVDRTIRYETAAEMGPWRRRLSFVAGEGRFGEAVDRAIEDMFARIVGDAVPYAFDVNLTYASASSPYLYPPARLSEKVVERMNEGCAILDYIGHGHVEGFDSLRFKGKKYPIFAFEDVPDVKAAKRPPIVLITACWTGCFDDPKTDAVGERLLETEDGPVAVFAATRVSHPYANAILSKELVGALFTGEPEAVRLGERFARGKKLLVAPEGQDEYRMAIDQYAVLFLQNPALMERLLWDDAHLFTLLGDPALVPAFPRGTVELGLEGEAVPGEQAKVRGKASGLGGKAGRAVITLEVSRKAIRGEIAPVDLAKPGAEAKVLENYERANDKVAARAEVEVRADGTFEATLALPDDLIPATKHYLKAYCWHETADAAGSTEVSLSFGDEEGADGE